MMLAKREHGPFTIRFFDIPSRKEILTRCGEATSWLSLNLGSRGISSGHGPALQNMV
jgi:hypothetical protein